MGKYVFLSTYLIISVAFTNKETAFIPTKKASFDAFLLVGLLY